MRAQLHFRAALEFNDGRNDSLTYVLSYSAVIFASRTTLPHF